MKLSTTVLLLGGTLASLNMSALYAVSGIEAYRTGDYETAAKSLTQQKALSPIEAYYLGQLYWYGYGLLKNQTLALQNFQSAASRGYLPAQLFMTKYALTQTKNYEDALKWAKLASASNIEAQMYCAAAYLFGLGTQKHEDIAIKYVILAARGGNSIAQYTLAEHFLNTKNLANQKLGLIWLEKSAAQNNPKAWIKQAALMINGKLLPKSIDNAQALLDKAIAAKEYSAYIIKGDYARDNHDLPAAKTWYEKAIAENNTAAMLALAYVYLDSKSKLNNPVEGFLLALKAAQAGDPNAAILLSKLYDLGLGTPKDPQLAKEWKIKSANMIKNTVLSSSINWLTGGKTTDLLQTNYALSGLMRWKNEKAKLPHGMNPAPLLSTINQKELFKPNFTLTSPKEISIQQYLEAWVKFNTPKTSAVAWTPKTISQLDMTNALSGTPPIQLDIAQLTKAADLGDQIAQYTLGQYYANRKDQLDKAFNYYKKSAEQGNLRAMTAYGTLLLANKENPADVKEGIRWLYAAAFAGSQTAQEKLARLLANGFNNTQGQIIIPANPDESNRFYFIASAGGSGFSQYYLANQLLNQSNAQETLADRDARFDLINHLLKGAADAGIPGADISKAFFNIQNENADALKKTFEQVKLKAEEGDPQAALLLGLMYENGSGTEASPQKAITWYEKSGKNPVADFILGTHYQLGDSVSSNPVKARELLKKAADQNIASAFYNLAIMDYEAHKDFIPNLRKASQLGDTKAALLLADNALSSKTDAKNIQEARTIYQQIASQGSPIAEYKMGYLSANGIGGITDYDGAIQWYTLSAEQGNALGQFLLARTYQMGDSKHEPDYTLSKQWYQSAEAKYPPAAIALGFIEETVFENFTAAKTHYEVAAKSDDPLGQYNLGLVYLEGKTDAINNSEAHNLFEKAANQNQKNAMVELAKLMFDASGGTPNTATAKMWYQKAASLEDAEAYYQLGLLFETGVSVPLDTAEAAKNYQKSVTLGNEKAMLALARMYQFGVGLAEDKLKARALYEQLSQLGEPFATYQLGILTLPSKKTPEQADLVKAREWFKKAEAQGSFQAAQAITLIDTKKTSTISFIQPFVVTGQNIEKSPVEIQYMDAMSLWNEGDSVGAYNILGSIKQDNPNYWPAKRIWEILF